MSDERGERYLFRRPESLTDTPTHYCPGCGHGVVHRLIAELIDEMGLRERAVGIAPVGCAVLGYYYFNFDVTEASHGRPPAVATGIKRARPDLFVVVYQGDGDLAAIGTAETIHAANRGENFTVVFVNNSVYGMTGGQMAPTTMVGQETVTTPGGRSLEETGPPIKVCELLASLGGTVYLARGALDTPAHIRQARGYLRRAFENQVQGRGYSLVEILSPCPTYWRMEPDEARRHITEVVIPEFPLGVIKDTAGGGTE
ncbi:MAG TPA: thiamine pyrophosphate-dependent enzyme [bacterium]|nr:thiamine pyrophosphate-dependent enzyme [bacterium]HPQ66397.1 thiamine pyrophosphate-dependent enzyme [bacterium]